MNGETKKQLRKTLRQRRQSLTPAEQRSAATRFAALISRQPFFRHCRSIGVYWANDGELDMQPLIETAYQAKKRLYLPCIPKRGNRKLRFLSFTDNSLLRSNRYGIPEPTAFTSQSIPTWCLDIVFLPLVGFDNEGNRLGMGGGFYDATFKSLEARPRRPLLIGVGHHCQHVDRIPTDSWDICLDAIVSDRNVVMVQPGRLKQSGFLKSVF